MSRRPTDAEQGAAHRQAASPTPGPAADAGVFEATMDAAVRHLRDGRPGRAEATCKRILETRPHHHGALHLLGVIALQTGGNQRAVDLIGKAVSLKPDYAEAHSNLGVALRNLGRIEEAIAAFRRAIALKPDSAEAPYDVGLALNGRGKFAEAAGAYRDAVALRPEFADAHNNLGNALKQGNRLDEAIAAYRKAIALKPDYAEAHYNLGNALKDHDDLDGAVAAYQEAIALNPKLAGAHVNLGNAFVKQDRLDEAIDACRKAVGISPDYAEAHGALGNALAKRSKDKDAIASYRRAVAVDPDLAGAHATLGLALIPQGETDTARACFRRAIEIEPDFAEAHFGYAKVHKFVPGDPEIGILDALLEREAITANDRSRILYSLGKAHDDIGQYAEAFSFYLAANEENAQGATFDASRNRRVIERIKGVFSEAHRATADESSNTEYVPVFVVGMSRSGRSSVEGLLSQHEDAHGVGENLEWSRAMAEVVEKYSISTPFPECAPLLSDKNINELGALYMGDFIGNYPRFKLLINTATSNAQYIGLILRALPTARIILCRRDSIDNCLYFYFKYKWGSRFLHDLESIASYYNDYYDLMTHWQRLYGDRVLEVQYEDLVRAPKRVAAQIYEFCGLDYDATAIRHAFTTDEIGHWKNYERYLDALRQALGGLAQQSNINRT